MRGKNDLPSGFHDETNGGEGKENPGVIRNLVPFTERNIKVDANEYPLSFQIYLVCSPNRHTRFPLFSHWQSVISDQDYFFPKRYRNSSAIRFEKPHSLSYQEMILTIFPPITLVES